jgi:hypothetical protein
LRADILPQNTHMRRVSERLGFSVTDDQDGAVHVHIQVAAAAAAADSQNLPVVTF